MEKLNYIETIGSEVREYEVTYDAEELNRFRLELIEKFSRIIHCDYVSHRNPYPDMALNPSEFMNYKETYVGQDPAGNLYRLEYDKIFYPTLVHYIDRVLNNKDVEYFKKIYNLDFDQKSKHLYRIKGICNDLYNMDLTHDKMVDFKEKFNRLYSELLQYERYGFSEIPEEYVRRIYEIFKVKESSKKLTRSK